jgi:hypothetical protein
MKKIFLILLFSILQHSLIYSQNENNDDNLYSKDNILLGKKTDIFKNCADDYFKNNTNIKLFDESNTFKNRYEFCECYITTMANNFTLDEISAFNDGTLNFEKEILKKNDSVLNSELMKCTKLITKNIDGDFDMKFLEIENCEKYYNNFHSELGTEVDFHLFCECVNKEGNAKKIKNSVNEINDESSVLRNEIFLDCYNKSKILKPSEDKNLNNDVLGNTKYENIPIIQNDMSNKVKISIGKVSKYFTIDSGASDTSISLRLEKELLLSGIIKKGNYISDGYYTIADGKTISCKRIKLNNIKIGGFIVNNVVISVRKTGTALLLGNSFFAKFKTWTINNNDKNLFLEKN